MCDFLPVCKKDLDELNIDELDFIFVTGDAYVDHPSFAHALIGRYLQAYGYTVGILAQPNFNSIDAFKKMGKPKLGFLIGAGNMDSMVNLYTVNKRRRKKDLYSPDGKTGLRPDRSTIVYTKKIREAYGNVPVIIGGIEAGLRRFSHYDYWSNTVMPSILSDSGADLLVYGMGEKAILEVAEALAGGLNINDITYIAGTVHNAVNLSKVYGYKEIWPFYDVKHDKMKYADAFLTQYKNNLDILVQYQTSGYIVQNPPQQPLTRDELDFIYSLPFKRNAHPSYAKPIPALQEVKYSITAVRGCVGECAFCALTYHQGKHLISRSIKSIVSEAEKFLNDKDFKGVISDVGGPTANLYGAYCNNKNGPCNSRRCLTPKPCKFFKEDQLHYLKLLNTLKKMRGIRKVFIRSGIRHDVALLDKKGAFIRELAKNYVSGQLKLAPEHVSERVLEQMGKPDIKLYERFCKQFERESKLAKKKQYILPYFMSSHPGCTMEDAYKLGAYLKKFGFIPEQAQDFYPTPGTLATCVYYTGINPLTKKRVFVERDPARKMEQRNLLTRKKSGKTVKSNMNKS